MSQTMTVAELTKIAEGMHKDLMLRSVDEKTALNYAEAMIGGAKFPPIIIGKFPETEKYGSVAIVDGIHRIVAAQTAKLTTLPVTHETYASVPAMLAEMYVLNQKHGLPVTERERNKRIDLLRKQGWKLADIAKAFGLHTSSIDRIVKGLQGEGKSGPKSANKSKGQKSAEPKKPKALHKMIQILNEEFARKRPNTLADYVAFLSPATEEDTEGEVDRELLSEVELLYATLGGIISNLSE